MKPEEFQRIIKTANRPLVVETWAEWCGPCKFTRPTLQKLAEEFRGRVDFIEVNADQSTEVMQSLRVFAIPTMLVYENGTEMLRQTGARTPDAYRKLFEQLAQGATPTVFPLSTLDRVLRTIAGLAFLSVGLSLTNYLLLTIGAILLFAAIYDRCPIWRALTSYIKRVKS